MTDVFSSNGLELSCKTHRCVLHGKRIELTDTRFSILERLIPEMWSQDENQNL